MFTTFLLTLRGHGLVIGVGEWLAYLDALTRGLGTGLDAFYSLGRALLCRSEADYDRYDQAFSEVFGDAVLSDEAKAKLQAWLDQTLERPDGPWVEHGMDRDELMRAFLERVAEQTEAHNGGNHWVGTGGTSPFGHSGRGAQGVRVGGAGGGRQAMNAAIERRWANYRTDRTLDVRDLQVALRALRKLSREGRWQLDLDGTIRKTCDNAGEIELVEERERANRVHLVLLMDAGGSMSPHYQRVSNLFSAAKRMKTFKTFASYSFHNCVYGWLYSDIEQLDRVRTEDVLAGLTPNHRLLFVGDASMAPYELFSSYSWPGTDAIAGIEWLNRFRRRCPASAWLNPDPRRYWDHPTVRGIGRVFPMHELTLDGLRDAIKVLRAPQ